MASVISLAEKSGNANHWTVEQMLEDLLEEVRSGRRTATKAVVLLLDDSGERYDIGYRNAGMRLSELVTLMDVAKTDVKKDMGY